MVHSGEDVVLHTTKTAKTHALSHFTGPWSIFDLLGHTSEEHLSESWGFFPLWFLVFHSAESAAFVITHAEPITVQSCPCWCACLSHLWLDNEHSECRGKQQGLWRMFLQYLCSLHISSLSCCLMQKSKTPGLTQSIFPKQELTQTIHIRLQLPVCPFIHSADASPQETKWAGWSNGHKTNMKKQMPTVTNWKIPHSNSAPKIKWNLFHYLHRHVILNLYDFLSKNREVRIIHSVWMGAVTFKLQWH